MDKIKKIIIIISIIIIMIIVVLTVMALKRRTEGSDYEDTEFEHDLTHEEIKTEISEVENRNKYYAVKNILGKYAYMIVDGGTESLYSVINSQYIADNKITKDNVQQYVESIINGELTEEQLDNLEIKIEIDKMYYTESSVSITTFFTYGYFANNVNEDKTEFEIIIEMDSKNNTFYVYPTQYMQNEYESIEQLTNYSTTLEEIPKNDYNEFSFENVEDAVVIYDYISKFKNSLVNDIENSYIMLDEEYRNKKFGNIEQYKEYVNENMQKFLSISISKYKVDTKDDYMQYTCIDKNGNYYIFKETAIMNYTMLLDIYTVELPEFTEKYESANAETKVGMNIEKIIQALNLNDYAYIYNHLDERFIEKNFESLEKFKQYMTEKYPSRYDVEYTNLSEEQGTYMQEIILKDKTTENQIQNTIIMQLEDDYDFVMSFEV